jgi:hypothetical protein
VKLFPQLQVTSVTTYSGWMPVFNVSSSHRWPPGPHAERGEPEPDST